MDIKLKAEEQAAKYSVMSPEYSATIDAYMNGATSMAACAMTALEQFLNDIAPFINGLDSEEIAEYYMKAVKTIMR